MTDRKLKQELKEYRNKIYAPFWGIVIAIASILYGGFIARYEGYLLEHSEPYISEIPEKTIGIILVIVGLIKLLAILFKHNEIKKYSIWCLSAMWTGLFFIALTYSFGTGHPNPSWIFYGVIMVGCYRVSLKGDFEH